MKKIVQLLILAFSIGICNTAFTQTINICGSDTIVLKTGNYQNGTIQWEESIDNISWTDVDGENDTSYKFYPTVSKYIRALARFSDCPAEYSEISFVQLPPKANAGADRTVSYNIIQMMANSEEGSQGVWDIISGVGGSFSDINNPSANFQGNDSTYNLVWSLSNTCGTSSDTIEIKIIQNEYKDLIALVDSADIILSDSAQIASGLYIIKFGIMPPVITDSTVLLGLSGDGFIRKVDSFTAQNDTMYIQTSQGSLTDMTINGAFNLGDINEVSETSLKSSSGYKRLDHLPTRAELLTDPKFKTGRYVYLAQDKVEYIRPGVTYRGNTNKSSGNSEPLINLEFSKILWTNANASAYVKLSGYYKFDPNIVVDFHIKTKWYGKPYLNRLKAGMYNGTIKSNYKIEFNASAAAELLDKSFVIFSKKKVSVFVIGGVPVVVTSELAFEGSISVNADANLNVTHEQTHISTYTAAIEYHKGKWSYPKSKSEKSEMKNTIELRGNLIQEFEIGPTVSFKVYGVVGPYVEARLTEDFTLCAAADLEGAGWQANLNIGGSITVGAKAEIASIDLFNVKKTWEKGFYHLQFPSKLSYVSGNNQNYEKDTRLAKKITVKAKSNKGFAIPGAIVHFVPKDGGSVSMPYVIANSAGEASTYWTPGGEYTSTLKAAALDCDGNNLDKSPITFFAISNSAGLACANSSLSASLKWYNPYIGFNYYKLIGNTGITPYTYSEDGLTYSSTAPKLYSYDYNNTLTDAGKTYMYYVKDNNGCVAVTSYTVGSCKNSSLAINTEVAGNVIFANATGGIAPYKFAVDNVNGNYTNAKTFSGLSVGNHILFVKDDGGCVRSKTEYLPASIPPIIANFTLNKRIAAVGSIVQFSDLSNNASTWQWYFGDGTTSNLQDPTHSYASVGNYSVKLVSSNATSSATLQKNNLIQVGLIPEAVFTADITSVELGQSVSFTNKSANSPTSVVWDFGDGTSSSLLNPIHTYNSIGKFTVKLTAINAYGSNSDTQVDYINVAEATSFKDARDGHVYNCVKIGNQTWMTENLAYLPSVSSPLAADYWDPTSTPKYFVYEYLGNVVSEAKATGNYQNYGVYYNVPATVSAAPAGWHIPTAAEWQELIDFATNNGYAGSEGNALKSCRQAFSPAGGDCATSIHPRWDPDELEYGKDAFGFSALPAAEASGEMGWPGMNGIWWGKSIDSSSADVPYFVLESKSGAARLDKWTMTVLGLSIRCVKD